MVESVERNSRVFFFNYFQTNRTACFLTLLSLYTIHKTRTRISSTDTVDLFTILEDFAIGDRRSFAKNVVDGFIFLVELFAQFIQLGFDHFLVVRVGRFVLFGSCLWQQLTGYRRATLTLVGRVHVHPSQTLGLQFTFFLIQLFLSDLDL